MKLKYIIFFITINFSLFTLCFSNSQSKNDERVIFYIVDTKLQDIKFYWQDENSIPFRSILNWLLLPNSPKK